MEHPRKPLSLCHVSQKNQVLCTVLGFFDSDDTMPRENGRLKSLAIEAMDVVLCYFRMEENYE